MPRSSAYPLPQPVFDEPHFNEGKPTPDPTRFAVPHPSDKRLYEELQALLYEDVVGFPRSRMPGNDVFELGTALGPHGPDIVQEIRDAGHITFHMVGDIGASTASKYPDEIRVSDQITQDCHVSPAADRPQFLFILGDVIYDFGEPQYYYDQFYDPYRNYPAPIFAVPGNHDSFVVPGTPAPLVPLATFQRNFCATEPVVTPEAGSLHRTAMTQPGVYFALDAPFVRILGLFSNALEDPGVISSESGVWTKIPDYQLGFLSAQLSRAKRERYAGALLLALHHPPFNYAPATGGSGAGGIHGGSPAMLEQIDAICQAEGVYPHAILSGHAHNYQRYTRSIRFGGQIYQVPFIVCGDSGHGIDALVRAKLGSPAKEPPNGADVTYLDVRPAVDATGLVLDRHDDRDYGYLRLSVDARELRIGFFQVEMGASRSQPGDAVSVDIARHTVTTSKSPPGAPRKSSSRSR